MPFWMLSFSGKNVMTFFLWLPGFLYPDNFYLPPLSLYCPDLTRQLMVLAALDSWEAWEAAGPFPAPNQVWTSQWALAGAFCGQKCHHLLPLSCCLPHGYWLTKASWYRCQPTCTVAFAGIACHLWLWYIVVLYFYLIFFKAVVKHMQH